MWRQTIGELLFPSVVLAGGLPVLGTRDKYRVFNIRISKREK